MPLEKFQDTPSGAETNCFVRARLRLFPVCSPDDAVQDDAHVRRCMLAAANATGGCLDHSGSASRITGVPLWRNW